MFGRGGGRTSYRTASSLRDSRSVGAFVLGRCRGCGGRAGGCGDRALTCRSARSHDASCDERRAVAPLLVLGLGRVSLIKRLLIATVNGLGRRTNDTANAHPLMTDRVLRGEFMRFLVCSKIAAFFFFVRTDSTDSPDCCRYF